MVRHLFPLSDDPKENFIAGFSMGGYGTLKWMLRDPEKFAAFGLFSGIKMYRISCRRRRIIQTALYVCISFGDRKNVKDTEDDVVYMIKNRKQQEKISTRIYGNWS